MSTAQNLLVFGRALGTGQGLLKPVTKIERLVSMPEPAESGMAASCINGWFGHSGYNTSLFYDTDTTVVVLGGVPDTRDDIGTSVPMVRRTKRLVAQLALT